MISARMSAGNVHRLSGRFSGMRRVRPTPILISGSAILVLAGGIGAVLMTSSSGGSSTIPPALAPVIAAVPFTPSDSSRLESTLRSGDNALVATAIAVPDGEQLDDGFVHQLATMNLKINASTFTAQDSRTATVDATTGDGRHWALVLTAPSTAWLVTATVPLS